VHDYLQLVDDLAENEVLAVSISGGEPYLAKEKLFAIIDRLKMYGIKTAINTNASVIQPDDIPHTKYATHFISVHGFKSYQKITGTNDLEATLKNIDLLKQNHVTVEVNFVATKHNIDDFEDVYQYFKSRGIPVFLSRARCPVGCDTSLLEESLEEIKQVENFYNKYPDLFSASVMPYCAFSSNSQPLSNRCTAGFISCTIGTNGLIRPCVASDFEGQDVFSQGLKTAWKSLVVWRKKFILPSECLKCVYVEECMGGCRMAAKAVFGSYDARDPLMKKPFYKRYFRELPEIYSKGKLLYKNPEVKCRREKFGWLLALNKNIIPVNDAGKKAFDFADGKNFIEVSKLFPDDAQDALRKLFTDFIRGRFLIPTGE